MTSNAATLMLAIAALAVSAGSGAEPVDSAVRPLALDTEIPCLSPPFSADASLASLRRALGADNVVEQTFETEGDPITLTVVYPNDARHRLEISWLDEGNRVNIDRIGVPAESGRTGPSGLATGMSIEETQRLNGEVFDIRGLGWDFGGDVANWRGGALARARGGCRVNVGFGVGNEDAMLYPPREIMGDRLVASDVEALRPVALHVVSIAYVYPGRH